MANKKNNQAAEAAPKKKQKKLPNTESALDMAIAAAISAPKPPKKTAGYVAPKPPKKSKSKPEPKKEAKKEPVKKEAPKKETKKQNKKSAPKNNRPKNIAPAPVFAPVEYNAAENMLKGAKLRIIPLGGLNEIGKNMTVIEYGNDIVIIDCGMTFPDQEMPGVDIVIPDFTYVEKNADKVRGVFLTHGHEDHIGGIPYLLKKLNVPVYGTKLTIGLVESKLKEHNPGKVTLKTVVPGETVKAGCFAIEFIHVNHSIPDAVAIAVKTPVGNLLHMGDFKVDYTPVDEQIIDLPRIAELGKEGLLALMSDSTNSERHGFTPSERNVGATFASLFAKAEGRRIIIATFSSNVHRVQQIIDYARHANRKVAIFGRSMTNVIKMGVELGYLKNVDDVIIDINKMKNYTDGEIVLITTGSQGEPMSALTRMALNDHRQVSITSNDFIIISARPIPGNEKFVGKVVNELLKSGAEVVYEDMYEIHVSGHACQEEQKLILALAKPKFFIPVHGEYKHLIKHANTAIDMGYNEHNIFLGDIGTVIETDGNLMRFAGSVPSGKVLVDGYGVGDVGATVLRDRKHLAEDGVIIVSATVDKIDRRLLSGPEVLTRGLVYERESEEFLGKLREVAHGVLLQELDSKRDLRAVGNKLKDEIGDYVFSQTKRRPMVITMMMDI